MRLSRSDRGKASIILVLTAVVAVMAGVQSDSWWPAVVVAVIGLLAYAGLVSVLQKRSGSASK